MGLQEYLGGLGVTSSGVSILSTLDMGLQGLEPSFSDSPVCFNPIYAGHGAAGLQG